MLIKIQVQVWDKHKHVAGLNNKTPVLKLKYVTMNL